MARWGPAECLLTRSLALLPVIPNGTAHVLVLRSQPVICSRTASCVEAELEQNGRLDYTRLCMSVERMYVYAIHSIPDQIY